MAWVSLGWLRPDGGRRFIAGQGRPAPAIRANTGKGTIFLADYFGPIEAADTVRLHPVNGTNDETLTDALRRHDTAIGYQTTALVTAALEGLAIICKDRRNIMSAQNWHSLLPFADWRYDEIIAGAAWEHLCQQI